MSNIYKTAAREKFRFCSKRGYLTVDQLFDLPLKSQNGCDLDTIARSINTVLKSVTEESFVENAKPDPKKNELSVKLDILKDIIKTKQDENALARLKLEKAQERRKILDAIGAKKDQALTTASLEELEKKLAELD